MAAPPKSRPAVSLRGLARLALGILLLYTGSAHLWLGPADFAAQVPDWLPLDVDLVIFASGIAELAIGAALIALPRHRVTVGCIAAAFFVAIFPGNISQYVNRIDAFGLNSDSARAVRLLFQPVFVFWALWATRDPRA